jgi:hypothetical protein
MSCLSIDPRIVQSSLPSTDLVCRRDQNLVATTRGVNAQNKAAGIRIRGLLSCPMLFSLIDTVSMDGVRRNPRHPAVYHASKEGPPLDTLNIRIRAAS